jgi:hypothetical protein
MMTEVGALLDADEAARLATTCLGVLWPTISGRHARLSERNGEGAAHITPSTSCSATRSFMLYNVKKKPQSRQLVVVRCKSSTSSAARRVRPHARAFRRARRPHGAGHAQLFGDAFEREGENRAYFESSPASATRSASTRCLR